MILVILSLITDVAFPDGDALERPLAGMRSAQVAAAQAKISTACAGPPPPPPLDPTPALAPAAHDLVAAASSQLPPTATLTVPRAKPQSGLIWINHR